MKIRMCGTAIAGMLMLGACSSVGTIPASTTHLETIPPVTHVPVITDPTADRLPIEAYLLSTSQQQALLTAQQILISQCMARYGFKYDVTESTSDKAEGGSPTARRYGVVNRQEVERYGYHPPQAPGYGTGDNGSGRSLPAAEILVLTGGSGPVPPGASPAQSAKPAGTYDGKQVPAYGCEGESVQTLTAHGGSLAQPSEAERINYSSFTSSMSDPQVEHAFRDWSNCMESKGLTYDNPMAAVADPRWRKSAPSALEIRTAKADVICKQRTNLVGLWFTVEAFMQNHEIKQNAMQLTFEKRGINAEIAMAEQVISRK